MKWTVVFRRRPLLHESCEELFARFSSALSCQPDPWRIRPEEIEKPRWKSGQRSAESLFELSAASIKGRISFPVRDPSYLRDAAQYDDLLVLTFNAGDVDVGFLAAEVLPDLAAKLGAYRAAAYDNAVARADFQALTRKARETGRDVDGRHGVYRFHPAMVLERSLLRTELGKEPELLVKNDQQGWLRIHGDALLINAKIPLKDDAAYHGVDVYVRSL